MQVLPRRLRAWLLLLAPALLLAGPPLAAQQPAAPVPSIEPNQTIPVDPLITVGTLPNGLRYYVRPNRLPRGRAELRLVVKAGSVLEDDDQRGLAHFVEHMAFNGSRNFPRQQIATFMQAIGMRFGAHVNAHTSFDETVYELQIPTTDARVIDQALLMMEDWTNGVTFDPAEVDKERGVILEEWRLGLGADARMQNTIMPILLQGSRYAERSPIGTPDSHPQRALRAAEAVLHRLVSPRPDGGDRRRRLRSRGDGSRHQGALRTDSRCRFAAGRARPIPSRRTRARSTRWPPIAKPRTPRSV